jgi:hypothetical protein
MIRKEASMNSLIRQTALRALTVLGALFAAGVLSACVAPPPQAQARSQLVYWPERQLLLSGDSRSGAVRVFRLVGERPVPVAVWRSAGRARVFDIRVDRDRGAVWVLGDGGVDLHAVESGAVLASLAAPSAAQPPVAGAAAAAQGGASGASAGG